MIAVAGGLCAVWYGGGRQAHPHGVTHWAKPRAMPKSLLIHPVGCVHTLRYSYVKDGEMKTEYPVIIGGQNFGCGSSREHAPVALGAAGGQRLVGGRAERPGTRAGAGLGAVALPSYHAAAVQARVVLRRAPAGAGLSETPTCVAVMWHGQCGRREALSGLG